MRTMEDFESHIQRWLMLDGPPGLNHYLPTLIQENVAEFSPTSETGHARPVVCAWFEAPSSLKSPVFDCIVSTLGFRWYKQGDTITGSDWSSMIRQDWLLSETDTIAGAEATTAEATTDAIAPKFAVT